MAELGVVYVDIKGDWDGFEKDSKQKASGLSGMFGNVGKLAGAALIGGVAAAVGVGIKGVIDFAGFQQSMNEVFTLLPDISKPAMDEMTGQVKDFAREFGVLPDQVVPALYQSISAGVPKDNVFEFLETAQKAARGGVTELSTAVDGISSVVNAYGSDVLSATQASDLMFTAVKLGKTNFEQLSASLFQVTPTAAALGVGFGDITAALAAMTAQGVPTSVATTQLRQLFVELSKEGTNTSKVFQEIAGQTFKDFIASGGNTQQALQLLEQYAADAGLGINDLFGSVEAGAAALSLTGRSTEGFTNALEGMAGSAGATEAAFDTMDSGLAATWNRIKSNASVALLEIGEALAPLVEGFMNFGMEYVPIAMDALRDALAGISEFVESIFGGFSTGSDTATSSLESVRATAVRVFDAFDRGGKTAEGVQRSFARIGDAIREYIGPQLELVGRVFADLGKWADDNSATFDAWGRSLGEIVEKVSSVLAGLFELIAAIATPIIAAYSWAWENFGRILMDLVAVAVTTVMGVLSGLLDALGGLIDFIVGVFTGDWSRAWEGIKAFFSGIWSAIVAIATGFWDQLQLLIEAGLKALGLLWDAAWAGIKAALGAAWDGIVWAATDGMAKLVQFMLGLPAKILSALGNLAVLLIPKGLELLAGMITGLAQKQGELAGWLAGLAGSVLGWIGDANSWLLEAGRNVIGGLLTGMKNAAGAVMSWIRSLLGNIKDSVLGFFGISSPSKLMMGYGEDVMDGFLLGMQKPDVLGTVDGISRSVNFGIDATLGAMRAPDVHVYIGDQELVTLIRDEVDDRDRSVYDASLVGVR